MRNDTSSKVGWMIAGGALVALGYTLGVAGPGAKEASAQGQGADRPMRQTMISIDEGGRALLIDQSNFAYIVDTDGKAVRVVNVSGRNEDVRVR